MRIGILQPGYLPWLGFFDQVYRSDVFVLYDDVQYDKHGWRNRNRIKTANGVQWLTVPVHASLHTAPLVKEVKVDDLQDWRKRHLFSIRGAYARAPHFKRYFGLFEEAYTRDWNLLVDLDLFLIDRLLERFGIVDKRIVRSSTLGVTGDRIERLIKICKLFGADAFYEGAAGRSYIMEADFAREGITVVFQDYPHPVYRQLHGEFVPYLSAIDLLFNHGDESLAILTSKTAGDPTR